jgi:hypothetical protein
LRIQRLLANNGVEDDGFGDMNEVDNHIHEIVYRSFLESDKYSRNGFVLGLYRISGVATFVLGMMALIQDPELMKTY